MSSPSTAPSPPPVWTHPVSRPFTIPGTIGVVGGGLLSAITAGSPGYHASWAVAYAVLVIGVAQIVLGVAQAALTGGAVRRPVLAWESTSWNLGNALVLAGTLTGTPAVLYAGIVLLVAALVLFAVAIRHGRRSLLLVGTWVFILILLVSMPIGAILQAVRG